MRDGNLHFVRDELCSALSIQQLHSLLNPWKWEKKVRMRDFLYVYTHTHIYLQQHFFL